jgi:hypothetical protein
MRYGTLQVNGVSGRRLGGILPNLAGTSSDPGVAGA